MTLAAQIEAETATAANDLARHELDELYRILGSRERAMAARPETAFDPMPMIAEAEVAGLAEHLREIGRRVAWRWARSLHRVICEGEDTDPDRQRLTEALGLGQAAAIAAVTSLLMAASVPAAIAAPLAAIIYKQFLDTALDTVCDYWGAQLRA